MNPLKVCQQRAREFIPAVIAVLGIALSLLAFVLAERSDEHRWRAMLEQRSELLAGQIHGRILDETVPVEALSIAVATYPDISNDDFHRLAQQARSDDPVVELAWLPCDDHCRSRLDASVAAGAANVSLDDVKFKLAHRITFDNEPPISTTQLFDAWNKKAAISATLDDGDPVLVNLRDASNSSDALLALVWPTYSNGTDPSNPTERRIAFLGFAVGVYHADAVLRASLRDATSAPAATKLFLGTSHPAAAFSPDVGSDPLFDQGDPTAKVVSISRTFNEFGREWTLAFEFPRDTLESLRSSTPLALLGLGLLLTTLIVWYLQLERRRSQSFEATVSERTHALKSASEQLHAIIEASPFAIACLDTQRHVTLWNRAAERVFGFTPDEAIGKYFPVVPESEDAAFVARYERVASGQSDSNVETRRKRKDGTIIEVRSSAAPYHDASGKLLGAVFTLEDITHQNELQRQLVQAQKMEIVGQLTGGVAHDFNNILGAIIANLDLVEEEVDPKSAASEFCKAALNAALSAAELVKRLLAFSRRQPLRSAPTDLRETVAAVVPLIQRTLGERIRIEVTESPSLWTATVDLTQLESAILNLAINARDAMPDGGRLRIETFNTVVDDEAAQKIGGLSPGDFVVVAVSDNGTGMPADVAARAFEPFFTTKGPSDGSGLGLSMVFGTLRQLGGTARIVSEVGVGTTVELYLPRAADLQICSEACNAQGDTVPGGRERVLLVEDNENVRAAGIGILRSLGYQVSVAQNADEAMHRIEEGEQFDLLFSDIVMSGRLSGIDLARELKKRDASIPILMTSGFANPVAMQDATSTLGLRVITKPYRRSDLAVAIRETLDHC